ncbi:hypothetical protein V3C99_018406 [Haemonchus contortus]
MEDYRETISIENGTITAGFPSTDEVKNLKVNFSVTYRRLQSLLRTLNGDEEKLKLYNDTLTTYLQEGVIEEAKNFSHGVATFYLPHRHVWSPSKSTKLRIVIDASSHAKGEYCLNDVIFEGHSLAPLIHEVVLQFRTHLNTMVADIQKAFLQIRLPKEHRHVTRFLWVKNPSLPLTGDNLRYFHFCRVAFGINASPAILNQSILKQIEQSQSDIASELPNSLYVDNVLLEGRTAEELLKKYTESKRLFSSIGMNLRDYLSNSVTVNKNIAECDRAASTKIKVGMQWNAIEDTITLRCTEKQANKSFKRTVLSQINGYCYDPLGLLSPLMVPAKIFLRDLHKQKYGWDDVLSEKDQNTWRSITSNVIGFEVNLPRMVAEKNGTSSHHNVNIRG